MVSFFLILSFLFWLIFIPFGLLFEGFRYISDGSPILCMLSFLSSHFDEEPSVEYFPIIAISDKIDGVNSGLEDDLEGSFVIVFDIDKGELGKSFFDIFLDSIVVTFDKIEGDVLELIIEAFDLVDELLSFGEDETLLFVLLASLHLQSQYYINIFNHFLST